MSPHQMKASYIDAFTLTSMLYTLVLNAFHSPDHLAIPKYSFFKASFQSQVTNEALIHLSLLMSFGSITEHVLLILPFWYAFPYQASNALRVGTFCLSFMLLRE